MPRTLPFRLCPFLVSIGMLAGCGGSNSHSSQPDLLGATIDQVAQAAMQQQGIPGMTVALAKNGAMLYEKGYGFSDTATQVPSETPVIFEIGSITKQFTAALIMQLQEQNRLHVDDPIATYLPEYNFPSGVTLRMLLTHTSGLADYTNFSQFPTWVTQGVSEDTVLTAVSQMPLEFQPGTQYSYSNSNFFALGTIIETLTGESYEANVSHHIFQPLGLKSTYYSLPPATQAAVGYKNGASMLVPAVIWDRSAAFAAGALSSNVNDLVAWDDALIHGKVVSAASFKAMTTSNGFQIPGGGSYGFGIVLSTFNSKPIIWHNGQIGGFTAETVVFLDSGFSLVVLTNDQDANPDAIILNLMNAVCNSAQLSGNC